MRSSVQIIEKRGWTRTIITRIMTNITAALTLLGGGLAVLRSRAK
jgi:hypothetical protein